MSAPALPTPAPSAAQPRKAMFQLGLLLPAAILSFTVGIAMGARGEDIKMLSLAIATTAVGLVPGILDQAREPHERHLVLSMFTLVFMVYLVVPIFTYYMPGDEPKIPPGMQWALLYPADITHTQTVALIALIALLLGYVLPFGRLLGDIIPAPRREWTTEQSLLVAGLWISIGWVIYLASATGILPKELGSGFLGVISFGTFYGIILLTFAYVKHGSRVVFIALCIVVPITAGFNFFTGSKRLFASAPALVVLSTIIMSGRLRARWILIGVAGLTILYPASEFYRNVILDGYSRTALDAISNPGAVFSSLGEFLGTRDTGEYLSEGLQRTGARLDGVGRASVIIRETPRSVPFQEGWTLANIFIAYVPRVLWPEKPKITIGKFITDTYGTGAESSTGPTWIGEFWMNYGLMGVIGGMFSIGFLLRLAHEIFNRHSRTIPALLASTVILYKLATTVGGGVVGAVNGVVFALGPILLAHAAVSTFGRDPGRQRASLPLEPLGGEGGSPVSSAAPGGFRPPT